MDSNPYIGVIIGMQYYYTPTRLLILKNHLIDLIKKDTEYHMVNTWSKALEYIDDAIEQWKKNEEQWIQ